MTRRRRSLYALGNAAAKNPIQLSSAIVSVVNFAVIMHWFTMTGVQVGGLNACMIPVLSLFVASKTTNTKVLQELSGSDGS